MELNKSKILDEYHSRINKIKSLIEHNQNNKTKYSNLVLFKDYLSRLFLWRDKLNINNTHLKSQESHNILTHLDNLYTTFFEQECANVKTNFNDSFIHLYACWNTLEPFLNLSNFKNLPSPYDSIIKIIIKGGEIYIHNGVYHIDEYGISISKILKGEEKCFLPSLDDAFLDFIDLKFESGELTEIVNYDDLWIKFNNKNS